MWIIVIFPALGADTRRFGGDREKRSTAFDSALKIHLDRLFFYDGIAPEVCINIYRLREQELRETRCLYDEIYSGGGARNYLGPKDYIEVGGEGEILEFFKCQSLYGGD